MMSALVRPPIARLARSRRAWIAIGFWIVIGIVSAVVARSGGQASGADHVMRGAFGAFVLPFATYAIVSAALGHAGMRHAVAGMVALGADRRKAALACALVACAVAAIVCGVLGAVVCAIAHGPSDPPFAADLFASTWVGALGGATYAAFFSAGSAIRGGAARGVFLALDWIIGSGAGVGSLLVPRGHVQSLMGGALSADLSSRASSLILFALLAGYLGLVVFFIRRPPRT